MITRRCANALFLMAVCAGICGCSPTPRYAVSVENRSPDNLQNVQVRFRNPSRMFGLGTVRSGTETSIGFARQSIPDAVVLSWSTSRGGRHETRLVIPAQMADAIERQGGWMVLLVGTDGKVTVQHEAPH